MDEAFLGMIASFGFNYAPRGWALCAGQLLAIQENSALFALLGTQFGGNGTNNFQLPDLRGRVMVGQGQGNGLTNRFMGEMAGSELTAISQNNMPAHTHSADLSGVSVTVKVSSSVSSSTSPTGRNLTLGASDGSKIYSASAPDTALNIGGNGLAGSINNSMAGGSIPVNNMQPYLVVNQCIALMGIFPSRN